MRKFLAGVGIIALIIIISYASVRLFRHSETLIPISGNQPDGIGVGSGNPEGWPEDAPDPYLSAPIIYSGENSALLGGSAANGISAVYNVGASREEVLEYYQTELEKYGWRVTMPNLPGDTAVIVAEKDTRRFDVYLIAADDVTAVTTGVLFGLEEEEAIQASSTDSEISQ